MLNALPKNCGTIKGRKEFVQPILRKRIKSGIIVTSLGIIIVARSTRNQPSRPRNRMRAKPKATSEELRSCPSTAATEMRRLLRKY